MGINKLKIRNKKNIEFVCFASSVLNLSHIISSIGLDKIDKILIIISENTANSLDINKIENYIIVNNKYKISGFKKIAFKFGYRDLLTLLLHEYISTTTTIYGVDHGAFYFLYKNKKLFVFEDGAVNYSPSKIMFIKKISNYIFGDNILPYGRNKNVIKLFLTAPERYKIKNRAIIEKIDLLKSINVANNMSLINVSSLNINLSDGVLITQPLSEDGIISECEKIRIYTEILKKENIKYIKPHPRELTDYSTIGFVISNDLAVEMLLLMDNKPRKLVTLFSTAVDNCSIIGANVEIKKYWSYGNSKIKKKFNLPL